MDHAINWVWQGCLIAAMTMVLLRVMERTRAQARYAVCWLAMAAVTLLPVLPSGFGEAPDREPERLVLVGELEHRPAPGRHIVGWRRSSGNCSSVSVRRHSYTALSIQFSPFHTPCVQSGSAP